MMASAAAHRLARKLAALPESAMRQVVLLEYLQQEDAQEAVGVLAEIQLEGRKGGPPFGVALQVIASLFSADTLSYELRSALYATAKAQQQELLLQLFFTKAELALPEFISADDQRTLTLGHRKAIARSHDRDLLARLLRDPEPPVINNVLKNPRITEDDVVRLAARRPTDPDVQWEIFNAQRWIVRYRIKRALILNPYTPSEISIRMLGFLSSGDLKLVETSSTLSVQLRRAAAKLRQTEGR